MKTTYTNQETFVSTLYNKAIKKAAEKTPAVVTEALSKSVARNFLKKFKK